MMRVVWGIVLLLVVVAVSACAVADVAKTAPPPLTLGPGPTIVTKGSCQNTADLDSWAQAAYYQTTEFVKIFTAASAKGRTEIYDDVLRLHDIRTDMIARPTPDCALEAQRVLGSAMEKATRALQSYSNGDLDDLKSLLPELNGQLQRALTLENELFNQLSRQLPGGTKQPTSAGVPGGG